MIVNRKRNLPVPTVLQGFATLAHFAIRALAIVRLSKEILNIAPSEAGVEGDVWMSPEGEIQWPTELVEYFTPETGKRPRPQLRRGNPADLALAKQISEVIARHVEEIKATVGSNFEQSPFAFIAAMQKQLISRDTVSLSDTIKSLTFTFRINPNEVHQKRLSFKDVNFSASSHKIGEQNIAIVSNNFSIIVASMEEWATSLSEGRNFRLKDIPGIRPSIAEAWVKRHASIENKMLVEANLSGVIQVIREARGPITTDEKDINLIVRDILWIRGFTQTFDDHPISDADYKGLNSERVHGSPIGFYYSIMEGIIYELKRLVVRDDVYMIEGVAFFDDEGISKTLNLHLPRFDDGSLNFSMGTLMGATTKQKRTGAWSVVAVRPNLTDQENRLINIRLGIYADAFMEMGRPEYNRSTSLAKEYFESLKIGGILSSNLLVRSAANENRCKIASEMEESFRNTFKTVNEYKANCIRYSDLILADAIENGELNIGKVRQALLELIEQQSSFAICPVSASKRELMYEEVLKVREAVQCLSTRSADIFSNYGDYRLWCERQN